MAAQVEPVPALLQPAGPAPPTPDQAYWKAFKNQLLLPSPHNAGITSISIPESNPSGVQADTFAVTSGSRVQIYGSKTRKLVKTITRFGADDTARSGVLRRDGRILLAGGDSGVVQAFDTASRAILRQWNGPNAHKQAVHVVRWNPSTLTDLMTCSDDRTVRLWDLTEDDARWTGSGHEDYVRCGTFLPGHGGHLVLSGSYDQTVRLWDTRQKGSTASMIFNIKAPVEDVIAMSSSRIAAAAGNLVSIVNLVAGKAEHFIRSHQKTVTAMATAQGGTRLLTGGLDGHVKIHNTASWELVTGFKHSAPVLSLAVVPAPGAHKDTKDDRHLAVGLQTGLLSLRTRLAGAEKVKAREREKRMDAIIAGTADEYDRKQKKKDLRMGIRARDRGKDYQGEDADIVIDGRDPQRRKKLRSWQTNLRKGRYALSLDELLPPDRWDYSFNPDSVFTLLTTLRHRSALRTALANRSEERLLPILKFCFRHLEEPQHLNLLYDVMLVILDLYSHNMQDWRSSEDDGKEVWHTLAKISRRIKQVSEYAQQAHSTLGMIEMLEVG